MKSRKMIHLLTGAFFGVIFSFLFALCAWFFHGEIKENESTSSAGIIFGKYRFTAQDPNRNDSFIEEVDSEKVIVPSPVVITKAQGDLIYCYREETEPHHKRIGLKKDVNGEHEYVPFPDKVWIVLDTRRGIIRFYRDKYYMEKLEVEVKFD